MLVVYVRSDNKWVDIANEYADAAGELSDADELDYDKFKCYYMELEEGNNETTDE